MGCWACCRNGSVQSHRELGYSEPATEDEDDHHHQSNSRLPEHGWSVSQKCYIQSVAVFKQFITHWVFPGAAGVGSYLGFRFVGSLILDPKDEDRYNVFLIKPLVGFALCSMVTVSGYLWFKAVEHAGNTHQKMVKQVREGVPPAYPIYS